MHLWGRGCNPRRSIMMRFSSLRSIVGLVIVLLVLWYGSIPAYAVPIQVDFTVNDFLYDAPVSKITGKIVYEALSITSPILSLSSIDLTIDGHAYLVSEVGFSSTSLQTIGGTLSGVDGLTFGADDFMISWYRFALVPYRGFYYTTEGRDSMWYSESFSPFSVTKESPVPEPTTILLLGLSLIGLGVFLYGKRKSQK
jgi:hypothetical protein